MQIRKKIIFRTKILRWGFWSLTIINLYIIISFCNLPHKKELFTYRLIISFCGSQLFTVYIGISEGSNALFKKFRNLYSVYFHCIAIIFYSFHSIRFESVFLWHTNNLMINQLITAHRWNDEQPWAASAFFARCTINASIVAWKINVFIVHSTVSHNSFKRLIHFKINV